jgi:hypothetical protein
MLNKHSKKIMPEKIPDSIDIVYFDNGIGAYWFDPGNEHDKIVLVFHDFTDFMVNMHNLRKLEVIFKNHHIIYIEYPGIGLSNELLGSCKSIKSLTIQLQDVYHCILRHKKWNKIIFFGMDYGSIIQAKLFESCHKNKSRLPDHVVQMNGFLSVNTCNLFKIPWFLQILCKKEDIDSYHIYRNKLKNPLIIFHSKNNLNAPFIDSIQLHIKMKNESIFVPLFGHQDKTLLSKENMILINKTIQESIL